MSSLFTIVAMAIIRYYSIVRYERSWHIVTQDTFYTSRHIQTIWGLALLIAIPPTFGFGNYVNDLGMIRYGISFLKLMLVVSVIRASLKVHNYAFKVRYKYFIFIVVVPIGLQVTRYTSSTTGI